MQKEPVKLKISDLPFEVERDLSYLVGTNPLSLSVMILGYILVAIGLFNIAFGPESVYVSVLSGPTFGEFLQLYPGPIATVGFVFAAAPTLIKNLQHSRFMQEMARTYVVDTEGVAMPEGTALVFTILDEYMVEITLNTATEDDEVNLEENKPSVEKV